MKSARRLVSSSDTKVATVAAQRNDATVTAVGPGNATILCDAGSVSARTSVTVRVVSRISVSPTKVELKMLDEPQPVALTVQAFESDGSILSGRVAVTSCVDENVCRGDNRAQLWAVGAGDSKGIVEVDGAKAEVDVHVVDARSADAKPKPVKGNPMLIYEKMFGEEAQAKAKAKEEREKAKKEKARKKGR